MKSLVLTEPNELVLQERPIPQVGANELLIRVKAASICHTDYFTMYGRFPGCKYPTVLGHEFSGIVERCGPGVTHVKAGDRVACMAFSFCGTCANCLRGYQNGCLNMIGIPFQMDGAYQEMVTVSPEMAFTFDERLSFAEAAITECAANGYSAAQRADIQPTDHVVVIGPGPIGLMALQAARLKCPATLTMLGTRAQRLELAERLGADHTINVRETDAYEAIMNITGGHGADVVIFCAGSEDAWDLAGRILPRYGRMLVEALPPTADAKWPVPVFDFTAKHISYLGVSGYNADQFRTTLALMMAGKLNVAPLITHRFSLDDYQEAFDTCEQRKGGAIKVVFELNKDDEGQ